MTNSSIPSPKGEIRAHVLGALLDIYDCWKKQLDKTGQPYYLKLWLFEPRFLQSQVVCATQDSLHFYDHTFFRPQQSRKFDAARYGALRTRLEKLHWDHFADEDHYDNCEVGDPELYTSSFDYEKTKSWFKRLMKKPHRTFVFPEPEGDRTESYSFRRGDVWVGGR